MRARGSEVADLLRDLRRVAEMPADDSGAAGVDGAEAGPARSDPGAGRMMSGVQVPYVFTVEELFEHFVDEGPPDVEQLDTALCRIDRNHGPALLLDLHNEGLLEPAVAAAHAGSVWSMAEYPDAYLEHEDWRWLFGVAGYTVNGASAVRPASALTLYRGSVPERRTDWSWTDNFEVATRYATGGIGYRPTDGKVWRAEVEPRRLLARNDEQDGRNESEYVVDTEGLVIIEYDAIEPPTARKRAKT